MLDVATTAQSSGLFLSGSHVENVFDIWNSFKLYYNRRMQESLPKPPVSLPDIFWSNCCGAHPHCPLPLLVFVVLSSLTIFPYSSSFSCSSPPPSPQWSCTNMVWSKSYSAQAKVSRLDRTVSALAPTTCVAEAYVLD